MKIISGNTDKLTQETRGWIMGHFINKESPFHNTDFEIKWGRHKKGENKEGGAKQTTPPKALLY